MSFDPMFDTRWRNVIQPAVEECELEPFRVDASKISDSILTKILQSISQSRLILADMTAISGIRNGNVMYEVGLAHAVRQPQEVLLFRSDSDRLLFDLAHVHVNSYSPDTDVEGSKQTIGEALKEAMAEIDTKKGLAVDRAINAIDQGCFNLLFDAKMHSHLKYPILKSMGDYVANNPKIQSLSRLLEMGLLQANYPNFTLKDLRQGQMESPLNDLITYTVTPLGDAVIGEFGRKMGVEKIFKDPANRSTLNEILNKNEPTD